MINASAIISGEYLPILPGFLRDSCAFFKDIFCNNLDFEGYVMQNHQIKMQDLESPAFLVNQSDTRKS